ncbi:MAG: type III pantothenate kinase, partial [Eggerthellaceae bacterium]|nr:type III pantothenate kinase [Eggerthellaceae bacterium]
MLLAADIGNTQTCMGVYEGKTLVSQCRFVTNKQSDASDIVSRIEENIDKNLRIDRFVLSCVVPALQPLYIRAVEELFGISAMICNAKTATEAGLFCADYPNPDEIGADRVADAVAARELFGSPVIVVDLGTATNIEVIDKSGLFVGGVIASGMEVSAAYLFKAASQLSDVELTAPERAIGRSSKEALQSGIVFGEADKIDGLVHRILKELSYDAKDVCVVATGGFAKRIAPLSQTIT